MRLDRKQLISGLPVKIVRDFLRRDDQFSLASICERLGLSETEAHELIKHLKSMELIETHTPYKADGLFWRRTIKGNAFCGAKFLKPIPREKALKIVNSLLERVEEVNKDNSFELAVTYVGLFGSLSKGIEEVGDIDLIINLQLKQKDKNYSFHDFKLHNLKAIQFIKNRNPYINIGTESESELKDLNIFPKQIFPFSPLL